MKVLFKKSMLALACIELFGGETSSKLGDGIISQHFHITRCSESLTCIICIIYLVNVMWPENACFRMYADLDMNFRALEPPLLKCLRKVMLTPNAPIPIVLPIDAITEANC